MSGPLLSAKKAKLIDFEIFLPIILQANEKPRTLIF